MHRRGNTSASGNGGTRDAGHVTVESIPSMWTETLILVASLDARASIPTWTDAIRGTPVHEALTARSGESRLTETVEGRPRCLRAASIIEAWTRVARIDAMLTICSSKAAGTQAVIAVDVVNACAAVQTGAATSSSTGKTIHLDRRKERQQIYGVSSTKS